MFRACLIFLSSFVLGSSALGQSTDENTLQWRALADGSQVATFDKGDNEFQFYRCKQMGDRFGCFTMGNFSSFGSFKVFGVSTLPEEAVLPVSGYECDVEPGSSSTQLLFSKSAGGEILKNFRGYPERYFPNNRAEWTEADVDRLARENGVNLAAGYFSCDRIYANATRLGGVRALFSTEFQPFASDSHPASTPQTAIPNNSRRVVPEGVLLNSEIPLGDGTKRCSFSNGLTRVIGFSQDCWNE